jgi:hypothetical protein
VNYINTSGRIGKVVRPSSNSDPEAPTGCAVNSKPPARVNASRLLWCLAVAGVLLLGLVLRLAYYRNGHHPDEVIPIGVVGYMRQTGDWDTNWAKADIDPIFRYDQYNFSSYHYGLFFFYSLMKLFPFLDSWRSTDGGFALYRLFSVLLATAAVWQSIRLTQRIAGRIAAISAGLLVAVTALLVQDAHYIRPEAFTAVLTLGVVALCWPQESASGLKPVGAAFLLGLLFACKVSMLALAWLPFVPLAVHWRDWRHPWLLVAGLPLAAVAGFAMGVPGALAHPDVFISGARFLANHYAASHPPHGHFPDTSRAVSDLFGRYFVALLGWPLLLTGFFGIARLVWRRQWVPLLLLAGPVAVFGGYFATRSVFFERNVSHVVPLFLILAGIGAAEAGRLVGARRPALAMPVVIALLAVLSIRPFQVTRILIFDEMSGRANDRQFAYQKALRAKYPDAQWSVMSFLQGPVLDNLAADLTARPRTILICIIDYNDEWTAAHVPLLLQRFKARLVADRPSTFDDFPVCTLHTYHRPRERYFLVDGRSR